MAAKDPVCHTCEEWKNFPSPGACIIFTGTLLEETVGSRKPQKGDKQKETKINTFVKAINAMLNEGGGSVLVHTSEPRVLGLFDEQIDLKLLNMIPDDSCYNDNFERNFVNGGHICFRVKSNERPLSTLDFNTKMSLNQGVWDLSHIQMRCLIRQATGLQSKENDSAEEKLKTPTFTKNKEVKIKTCFFQEGVGIEAKRVPDPVPDEYKIEGNKGDQLAHYIWEALRLPHYISAFSKLPGGGSMFFGLPEEKIDQGTKKESKTGAFVCEGLLLGQKERGDFTIAIQKKVSNRDFMVWVSAKDVHNPVKIKFHPVTGENSTPELCVIEVKVFNVDGVAFYRNASLCQKSGPLAFKLFDSTDTKANNEATSLKEKNASPEDIAICEDKLVKIDKPHDEDQTGVPDFIVLKGSVAASDTKVPGGLIATQDSQPVSGNDKEPKTGTAQISVGTPAVLKPVPLEAWVELQLKYVCIFLHEKDKQSVSQPASQETPLKVQTPTFSGT